MDRQLVKWCVDLAMGIAFLVSFITGLLKLTLLLRVLGLTFVMLPLARISDIHDWSGIVLGCCVAVHLFLNRRWIISTTKKVLSGSRDAS
jgi:cytochrome b subunit of formate dehydrogenase